MKRVLLTLLAASCMSLAMAQQTWIHTSDNAKYSWAFVKDHGREPAHVTLNAQGVNWTETVSRDEILVLREGKKYVITDTHVLDNLVAATKPLGNVRKEYSEFRNREQQSRMKVRTAQREIRSAEREITLMTSARERARDDQARRNIEARIAQAHADEDRATRELHIAIRTHDADTKESQAMSEKKNKVRDQVNSKIEKLLDEAFARGLAKQQ